MAKDPALIENINLDEWFNAHTYDRNYRPFPNEPGIYLIVIHEGKKNTIVYVGSSDNLYSRCKSHPIRNRLIKDNILVSIYFKTCDNYRIEEKRLIKLTQARYNKQWR